MLHIFFKANKYVKQQARNPHFKIGESYKHMMQRNRLSANFFVPINDARINIIRASHKQNDQANSFGRRLIKFLMMKIRLKHNNSSTLLESSTASDPHIWLYKPLITPHYAFLEKIRWVKGVINTKNKFIYLTDNNKGLVNTDTGEYYHIHQGRAGRYQYHLIHNGKVYIYNYPSSKMRKLKHKVGLNRYLNNHKNYRPVYSYRKYWTITDAEGRPMLDIIRKGVREVKKYINHKNRKNSKKYPVEFYEMSTEFKPDREAEKENNNLLNVHAQGLMGSIKHLNGNDKKHLNKVIRDVFCKATGYDKGNLYVNAPVFQFRDGSKADMFFNYLDAIYTQKVLPLAVRHKAEKKIDYLGIYDQYFHKMHVLPQVTKQRPKQDYTLMKNWKYNKAFVFASENSVHDKVMRVAIQPKRQINMMNRARTKRMRLAEENLDRARDVVMEARTGKDIYILKKLLKYDNAKQRSHWYRKAIKDYYSYQSMVKDSTGKYLECCTVNLDMIDIDDFVRDLTLEIPQIKDEITSGETEITKMTARNELLSNKVNIAGARYLKDLIAKDKSKEANQVLHIASIILYDLVSAPISIIYHSNNKKLLANFANNFKLKYIFSIQQLKLGLLKPT